MKGLGKILFGLAIVTATLLLYVHERVEMIRVSYRIHDKSVQLSERTEEFRHLKFQVTQFRSPQHLEKKMNELELALTLPKQIQVLKVPASKPVVPVRVPLPLKTTTDKFFDFLGQWTQIAQARTEQ
jgi:cell division protein FtsL